MKVAFQGVLGAYSHLAAAQIYPEAQFVECETFAQVLDMVKNNVVDRAVIPVENSNAGRVADVHFLLPKTGLYIIGEHYLKVRHQLWGLPDADLKAIEAAYSHPQALAQCSEFLHSGGIKSAAATDTALSCRQIKEMNNPKFAAIASEVAGKLYGLKKLASDIQNSSLNTTRFLIMSKQARPETEQSGQTCKTSMIFRVKNIHSALFHALKCFADEQLNLLKIESYMCDDRFFSAQFYVEVEAGTGDKSLQRALSALKNVCESVHLLGTYPQMTAQ